MDAPFWNGGVYEVAGSPGYESGEKIVGQEYSLCSEKKTCSVCKARMGIIASAKGESDDQECGRQRWAFPQIHEPYSMERRSTDLEERKKRMPGCWTAVKQRGKNGQGIGSVTKSCRTWRTIPWKNEELKKLEEALPNQKECEYEKVSRLYKAKTGVVCDGFHPKVPWT